jgi:hypothetical protein
MIGHWVGLATEIPVRYIIKTVTGSNTAASAVAYVVHEIFIEPITNSLLGGSVGALIESTFNFPEQHSEIELKDNKIQESEQTIIDKFKIGSSILGSLIFSVPVILIEKNTGNEINSFLKIGIDCLGGYVGAELYDHYHN